jgi:hypothetical protein
MRNAVGYTATMLGIYERYSPTIHLEEGTGATASGSIQFNGHFHIKTRFTMSMPRS